VPSEGAGPFPCAILITGSGQQDRDETLLGHKPFLVIADYLTRRGIAVLRVDDRGVGGSTGLSTLATATSADFATDVSAGLTFLKTRPEIDPKRIGLIGHSEGGLIAPLVAAARPNDVVFVVLLAGPGVPGDKILSEQSALIAAALGAPAAQVEASKPVNARLFAVIKAEADPAERKKKLDAVIAETAAQAPEGLRDKAKADLTARLAPLSTPWFHYFFAHDPAPTLSQVRCPVLALNGSKDLQVPPKQSLPAIEAALKGGGNKDYTLKELPGLNHLFQTAKTGSPAEYADIEETFSPDALKAMGDWVVAHTAKPAP
jgi:pimeloyl-ACP methyl ester carboxylesterase